MEKLFFENNEDVVMNSIYNNFKNEVKQSSIITEEANKEILNEGLKHFKTSGRLYKLANKLALKSKKKDRPELMQTVKKINDLAQKFENAEDLYDIGRKAEAKTKYKELVKSYSDLLKLLKKSDTMDALKAVGGVAMTIVTMTVPYMMLNKFFPTLSFGATQKAAAETAGMLNQGKIFLKRAGAMTLCGIPAKAANNALGNGLEIYDDKILKQVDNLLS